MKHKTVIGTTDNSIFGVTVGKKCNVIKHFFFNGEGWYKLEDTETKVRFTSPDVFWDEK